MYIACPKCDWRPPPNARWACSCGHHWHTFATRGVCPRCGTAWRLTQCFACQVWSDHEDWYHPDDGGLTVEEFIRQFEHDEEPAPTSAA